MLISCSDNSSNNNLIKINSIVCFGDSLTRGYGATNEQTYPYFLQQFTNLPVINKGINGNTSRNGLDRIDDILQFKNSIVIVEFGANDFFQRFPVYETKKNMEKIVDILKQNNDIVVLVSTENNLLKEIHNMLKSLAEEKNVLFVNGILDEIWDDRSLFFDDIHPNSKGYKLVADKIYKNIKHLL